MDTNLVHTEWAPCLNKVDLDLDLDLVCRPAFSAPSCINFYLVLPLHMPIRKWQ